MVRTTLLVSSIAFLLLAACTQTRPTLSPTSTSKVPAEPSTLASGSTRILVTGYPWQPERLDLVAQNAALVVEGVVDVVLPAVWTTSGGAAPSDVRRAFEQASAHLRTPFQLSVDRVFKGSEVPSTLVFSVYGGTVGEFAVTTEELERLKPGAKVIVFLKEHPQFPNVSSRLFPNLFFVIDGDIAHGPVRDIPVSDLVGQLQ